VFTAQYALSPHIKQIRFIFKGLMQNMAVVSAVLNSLPGQRVRNECGKEKWIISDSSRIEGRTGKM
jgi:hypothetical protein